MQRGPWLGQGIDLSVKQERDRTDSVVQKDQSKKRYRGADMADRSAPEVPKGHRGGMSF